LTRREDLLWAPLCEAALLLLAGLAGWAVHTPLLFASLGPTAYELVETPERRSAQPYNVLAGHGIAILAGMAAIFLAHAQTAAPVSQAGVPQARIIAGVIAAALTVVGTLLARASQPAALSTALLVSLGVMQGWRSGAEIFAGVLLITLAGEPIRRWRLRRAASE
jgi:hypothetical protein